MVRAWLMDDDTEADQRLEHQQDPPRPVSLDKLVELGVEYWQFDPDNYDNDPKFQELKRNRGYSYQDRIECSPDKLNDYEARLRSFYDEHIHTDEEIRFVLDGSGYFDVRDLEDQWIRIQVTRGDLIVLPAGIFHRFTLDEGNYVKGLRLFIGEPVWTAYSRSQLDTNNPTVQRYRRARDHRPAIPV